MTTTSAPATNAFRLNNGDTFPALSADLVDGGTLNLPQDLSGSWGVVLFYRGDWCPFCRGQLSDFQRHLEQFGEVNAKVVALSVDAKADAEQTVNRHHLTFPVAYGLDAQAIAAEVGNYLSDGSDGKPTYSQATGFVLSPDGKVVVALYSSSAIGRLNAADTLGLIKYAQQQG